MVVQAYVLFKVGSGTEKEVCEKIVNFDEVMTAGIVYGEYDVVARISVPDLEALETFLSQKMRNVPSVILTSTMIMAREYLGKTRRKKNWASKKEK
jgi:DNA-binding Lrp family transcriptional regulator